jgi:hypothetical protein
MINFVVPIEDLEELADLLDSGKLEVLRDRHARARRTKQPLSRYTSRIWLFPFGIHPSSRHPVEVFRNGMVQWMDNEVKLFQIGRARVITVAVFLHETREGDRVQATYVAVPSETG